MVTINVNGVTLEGETLKEAQRLARKEERRQAALERALEANSDIAYTNAYAEIGRLINGSGTLWFTEACNTTSWKQQNGYTEIILGEASIKFSDHNSPSAFILSVSTGLPRFMRSFYYNSNGEQESKPEWYVFGIHDNAARSLVVSDRIAELLESEYQRYIGK